MLHKYLRAVGFSKIKTKKQLEELITECIRTSEKREYITMDNEEDGIFVECCKDFAPDIGIVVRGEFDDENNFTYDYYFPYIKGNTISSEEDVSIERHAEKESYAGVCDDLRIGVSLIFYFQNIISYLKIKREDRLPIKGTTLMLAGLSTSGSIMLPIIKNEKEKNKIRKVSKNRNQLIAEARKGDEEAIESLTLEDMDTYTTISKKIQKEDVFSLVDTYFMPYGVECDQYSVLGEITECESLRNSMTGEELYRMSINCNEMVFDVCINKEDLLGEPQIGRRFKGTLWMQGFINFP